jgi:hypothetical protein
MADRVICSRVVRRGIATIGSLEWLALAALAALSLAVQAELVWTLVRDGGAHSGSDGLEIPDQAQYLAWARLASDGPLLGNPFDLEPGAAVWLHPGFAASGGLTALGLSPGLALLVWKPVAVATLFAGAVVYAHRLLPGRGQRAAAVALALFAGSPILAALQLDQLTGDAPGVFTEEAQVGSISREMWPVAQLWGYPFAAIAVGSMPLVLVAYERARARLAAGERPGAPLLLACAGALFCAWVHPWQGAVVVGAALAAELWPRRPRLPLRRAARTAVPLAAAAAVPIAYLGLLGVVDDQWRQVRDFTEQGLLRWDYLIAGLVPLGLVALLALRRPAEDFGQRALRLWIPVALIVYLLPGVSFRQHALEGLSIPLAMLAVQGVDTLELRRLPGRTAVAWAAVVGVMIAPVAVASLLHMHERVQRAGQPQVIRSAEADALGALEDLPEEGGVLATARLGQLVPGRSGRETWLGPAPWTPDMFVRRAVVDDLFGGRLSPAQARAVARRSGARLVLTDCETRADVARLLGPLVERAVEHGCAAVLVLRP